MAIHTAVAVKQGTIIPSFNLGGSGEPLHFLHANGYPPACYQPLLALLQSRFHVFGMLLRPLWPDSRMDDLQDWNPLSDDLLTFLHQSGEPPLVAVGHSIGAIVSLRAALRDPAPFRALVLLDPVLFPPSRILAWNVMRALRLGSRMHPLVRGALRRRRQFSDLDAVFRGYRRRPIFRHLSDEGLRAYISGIVRHIPGGYELAYSPEWEAHIYYTGIWRDMELWRGLPGLNVPTMIIRGAETDTFGEAAARLAVWRNPAIRVETLERSTHLLPLERPSEVFDMVQAFLKEIQ